MLPVAQSVYTSCEKTSSKQTESNTKCLRKTEFIHCCLLGNRLSVCLETAVAANCSSSREETGARLAQPVFGLSGSLPLNAPGCPGTRQGPEPLPAGCDMAVTSPATRSRSCPSPSAARGPERSGLRTRAVPGRWEQERCPGAVSPGALQGCQARQTPPPAANPLPQPLSFLSIGLLSSPTITQGRVQPDHPCATKGCGGGCGLCFKELKPDSASSKVKEEEVPREGCSRLAHRPAAAGAARQPCAPAHPRGRGLREQHRIDSPEDGTPLQGHHKGSAKMPVSQTSKSSHVRGALSLLPWARRWLGVAGAGSPRPVGAQQGEVAAARQGLVGLVPALKVPYGRDLAEQGGIQAAVQPHWRRQVPGPGRSSPLS